MSYTLSVGGGVKRMERGKRRWKRKDEIQEMDEESGTLKAKARGYRDLAIL